MVQGKAGTLLFAGLCAVALVVSVASAGKAATQETVLYRFPHKQPTGQYPDGLTFGPAGALYGTTYNGGPDGVGTVFRLIPPTAGHGAGTLDTLFAFQDSTTGAYPLGKLAIDKSGAIYGTTGVSRKNSAGKTSGWGGVFKLSPPGKPGAAWKESVLFRFNKNLNDGFGVGLVMDSKGALYGAAPSAGPKGFGTIFKLTPPTKGQSEWTVTTLHAFRETDGSQPSSLVIDQDGALYGTTDDDDWPTGHESGDGTVFKLTPPANSGSEWAFATLHEFSRSTDGNGPNSLVIGPRGTVYGVTSGATGFHPSYQGTVFKLTPPANGKTVWKETTLYTFPVKEGDFSGSGLVLGKTGSLFGTTSFGGTTDSFGYGTVFRLDPPATGGTAWVERTIYAFKEGKDGAIPFGLVIDPAGTLYGATDSGGGGPCSYELPAYPVNIVLAKGCGVVYQVTP
jgi:uncharacterized repeat protein (TIGR03803 family)